MLKFRIASCALACAASLHGAVAAGPPGTKPAPPPLTRAELKACTLAEDTLKANEEAIRTASVELDRESAWLSTDAKEIAELLRTLDETDQGAVEIYNLRVAARNSRADAQNKRVEALNAAASDLRSRQADHIAACASRPFLLKDREAVMRELGRDPKKPGTGIPPPGTPARSPRDA